MSLVNTLFSWWLMLIRLLSFLAFFFNFHVSFVVLFWKLQGYIVLNRPWAFVQWLQQADIKEEYGLFLHTIFKIFCLYESFMSLLMQYLCYAATYWWQSQIILLSNQYQTYLWVTMELHFLSFTLNLKSMSLFFGSSFLWRKDP